MSAIELLCDLADKANAGLHGLFKERIAAARAELAAMRERLRLADKLAESIEEFRDYPFTTKPIDLAFDAYRAAREKVKP